MTRDFVPNSRRRRARFLALAAALTGAASLAACGDVNTIRADQDNTNQTFTVFALTGTPTNAPAAISFSNKSTTRIDGSLDFDVAFDLSKTGAPMLLPLGQVGTPVSGARSVGMLRVSGTFESVTEAPRTGYVFDSTMVVAPGQVIVVQSQEPNCSYSFTPYIFTKIVIDSVNVPARALYGRTLINLNCGFRSLAPGTPKF
jgi:hypothetical protein